MKRAGGRRELAFAAIPLLFGIQQIIEGVLWLSFHYDAVLLKTVVTYIFTMFSHVLWPIYVPFAVVLMEREPWREKVIWGFTFVGIAVGIHLLILITTQSLTAVADEHIIYVSAGIYDWPMMMLYISATCLAPLFSSYRLIQLFGAMTLLLFAVAYWFYTAAFFSVWCFFAAILSAVIYLFFRGRGHAAVKDKSLT